MKARRCVVDEYDLSRGVCDDDAFRQLSKDRRAFRSFLGGHLPGSPQSLIGDLSGSDIPVKDREAFGVGVGTNVDPGRVAVFP